MEALKKYKIIRFYRKESSKIIKRNLYLSEAQKHCKNPNTRKEGVFFDGYEEQ